MSEIREPTQRDMQIILDSQRRAYLAEGHVSAETRIDRIERAINILKKNGDKLSDAMNADFGHRSLEQSQRTDIEGSIGPLQHAKKHLKSWMKPEKRKGQVHFWMSKIPTLRRESRSRA